VFQVPIWCALDHPWIIFSRLARYSSNIIVAKCCSHLTLDLSISGSGQKVAAGSDERARHPQPHGGDGGAVSAPALSPRSHGQKGVRRTPSRRGFGPAGRLRRGVVVSPHVRCSGANAREISDVELDLVRNSDPDVVALFALNTINRVACVTS